MNESIISDIKTLYHNYRRKHEKSPEFLLMNNEANADLFVSVFAPHYFNFVDGGYTFMGMTICVSDRDKYLLEVK